MPLDRLMPRYKCHKEVFALKIKSIRFTDQYFLTPADEGFADIPVDYDYMEHHKPEPGGYFVQYDDGYISFSPAKAFENGYTKI